MGLGDKVFSTDVTIDDVGIQYVKDGTKTPIAEDTTDESNNAPMPSGLFYKDTSGNYVPVSATNKLPVESSDSVLGILATIHHDASATAITTAGITVGAIVSDGYQLHAASNANDIIINVNGVDVATVLAGSSICIAVEMTAGDILLKSAVGADIDSGTVSINIVG